MSFQEMSVEQFIRFLHDLYNMLRPDSKLVGELENKPAVISNKTISNTSEALMAHQAMLPRPGVSRLERYYAEPGHAEWGC